MADAPVVIPEFDGIKTTEPGPHGCIKVLSNGDIFVVPTGEHFNVDRKAMDAIATESGFSVARLDRKSCFRTSLRLPPFPRELDEEVIAVPSGAIRIPRTAAELENIRAFADAILANKLDELVAGGVPHKLEAVKPRRDTRADARMRELAAAREKQAAEERERSAQQAAADAKWAVASGSNGGFHITKTDTEFVLKPQRKLTPDEYRSITGTTVGGRWASQEKAICVPLEREVKLGRFLARIQKRLAAEQAMAKAQELEWRATLGALKLPSADYNWSVRCYETGNIEVRSPYDADDVEAFRNMRGRWSKGNGVWYLPLSAAPSLIALLAARGLLFSSNLQEHSPYLADVATKAAARAAAKASRTAERQAKGVVAEAVIDTTVVDSNAD